MRRESSMAMNGSGNVVNIELPEVISVPPMKSIAGLGDQFRGLDVYVARMPQGMLVSGLMNGLKYFLDAAITHRKEQNKKAGEERDLNEDEVREVFEAVRTRFYDPEWKPRTNGAEPMSEMERAVRELIRPKFYELGVIRRANKKAGVEAFTLEDFLGDYESTEEAVRSVANAQIRANAAHYTDEKVNMQIETSWKALQAKAQKLVKTWEAERKLKAASAKTAEDEHVLEF